MKKKIIIPYFPIALKYSTPLPLGLGIYLILTSHVAWGVLLILIGILILTTNYVTEINLKDKTYSDFLSMFGLKVNNESKKFRTIDRIVVSKGNYAQTINTRAQSRQMDWSDYTGTLIFDNDSLDLLTRTDKKELLKGLKEFSDAMNVGVEDRTTSEYYWIDMSKIHKDNDGQFGSADQPKNTESQFEMQSYYGNELSLKYLGDLSVLGGSQVQYLLKREFKK